MPAPPCEYVTADPVIELERPAPAAPPAACEGAGGTWPFWPAPPAPPPPAPVDAGVSLSPPALPKQVAPPDGEACVDVPPEKGPLGEAPRPPPDPPLPG